MDGRFPPDPLLTPREWLCRQSYSNPPGGNRLSLFVTDGEATVDDPFERHVVGRTFPQPWEGP